jgi:hypothetical protein
MDETCICELRVSLVAVLRGMGYDPSSINRNFKTVTACSKYKLDSLARQFVVVYHPFIYKVYMLASSSGNVPRKARTTIPATARTAPA